MEKSISVAEAKATLSECIRQVESGSLMLITRHGKPVAALVRPADLEHLERLRKAGPESGLAGIAGGWENSEDLAAILDDSLRHGQRDIANLVGEIWGQSLNSELKIIFIMSNHS